MSPSEHVVKLVNMGDAPVPSVSEDRNECMHKI